MRAISATAAWLSNQWKAWATTTASIDPVATGIRSAVPAAITAHRPTESAKTARIEGDGSTATHLWVHRSQLPGHLAGTGGQVEHPALCVEPQRSTR